MATVMEDPKVGYPSSVAKFAGRINDVDVHEWTPPELWGEVFGRRASIFSEVEKSEMHGLKKRYFKDVDCELQSSLSRRSAWFGKGPYAYGSWEMDKRLELMDFTGVDKALIFPGNIVIHALFLIANAEHTAFWPMITGDRRKFGYEMIGLYNDWVMRTQAISPRLRPVGVLVGDTPERILAEARRMVDASVRAVWLPGAQLPGGRSPAHGDLDPLWRLLSESNTAVTLHVGDEGSFLKTLAWKDADAFKGWLVGEEISLDPWTLSAMPMASQNFTATMVTGGVFHRHPNLRLAVVETGAHWIGPLAHALDMWAENTQTSKWKERLPLRPSEYISSNIRVAGFPWEPIDKYVRDNGLEEIYCYASDFPHVEGGTDPMGYWAGRLQPLGDRAMEKFFVTNAQWVMPD